MNQEHKKARLHEIEFVLTDILCDLRGDYPVILSVHNKTPIFEGTDQEYSLLTTKIVAAVYSYCRAVIENEVVKDHEIKLWWNWMRMKLLKLGLPLNFVSELTGLELNAADRTEIYQPLHPVVDLCLALIEDESKEDKK